MGGGSSCCGLTFTRVSFHKRVEPLVEGGYFGLGFFEILGERVNGGL
jgi:hypothetical protein